MINKKISFVNIPENNAIFYIIPEDRGGEKVANLDKKSLNLNIKKEMEFNINKPENLFFSIQFYTDKELANVRKFLEKTTKSNESVYYLEDFYILSLESEISLEYLLLYKNFDTREEAKKYCLKFLSNIERCLIVDTNKLN